jgi:predicted dienelactone hydrolase
MKPVSRRVLLSLVLAGAAACAKPSPPLVEPPTTTARSVPASGPATTVTPSRVHGVGLRWTETKDPISGAALTAAVFYPASVETASEAIDGYRIDAARGAPMVAGRQPLILLSHGRVGGKLGHHDVAESLARHGYIVAAVEHASPRPNDRLFLDRPLQASAVLDAVLADAALGPHIDASRIGAVGYSRGGYTVLLLLGAHPDLASVHGYCVRHPKDPIFCDEEEWSGVSPGSVKTADPRIRAGFVMAPSAVYFGPGALREVRSPIFLYAAAQDQIVLPSENAELLRRDLPHLDGYREIPRANHFVFLPPCEEAMAAKSPALCSDPPGVDRRAVHAAVQRDVADFFAKTIGPEPRFSR